MNLSKNVLNQYRRLGGIFKIIIFIIRVNHIYYKIKKKTVGFYKVRYSFKIQYPVK